MRLPELIEDVLDFCFPGRCAACAAACAGRAFLCANCEQELDRLANAPACLLCGKPLARAATPCAFCKGSGVRPFDRILRLGCFDEPLRGLIHLLKYHRRWTLGEQLADRLLELESVKGLLSETQLLVPVPLHLSRQRERGYNQAEVIARRLGRLCRIPVASPAIRVRATETQTHLHSRAHRIKNLKDAFALKPNDRTLKGKHVVLIDDVMTTGATLQTLARTLKKAKPASICAIVLAVADPLGRGFEVT